MFYFTDKESEPQTGLVTCPREHSQQRSKSFQTGGLSSELTSLTTALCFLGNDSGASMLRPISSHVIHMNSGWSLPLSQCAFLHSKEVRRTSQSWLPLVCGFILHPPQLPSPKNVLSGVPGHRLLRHCCWQLVHFPWKQMCGVYQKP